MFSPDNIRIIRGKHVFYFDFGRWQIVGRLKVNVMIDSTGKMYGASVKIYRVDASHPSYHQYFHIGRRFDVAHATTNIDEIYDSFDRIYGRYQHPNKPEFVRRLIETIQYLLKPIDIGTTTAATAWCCLQIRGQWRDLSGMIGERILAHADD